MKKHIDIERLGFPDGTKGGGYISKILIYIFLIVIFGGVSIYIQNRIQNSILNLKVTNDLNAAWLSSLASYWGGILGGIFSGTLTFIGVAWTIYYYRKADESKNRIEHMPFLKAETIAYSEDFIIDGVKNGVSIFKISSKSISSTVDNNDERRLIFYRIKLQNIGRGFAKTLVIQTNTIGGVEYNELIQINESTEFCLEITAVNHGRNEIDFNITFVDAMTNEYCQSYTISWENNEIDNAKCETGYPCFLGQISSKR